MPKVRIPVRVGTSDVPTRPSYPKDDDIERTRTRSSVRDLEGVRKEDRVLEPSPTPCAEQDWRDRALRLQAEMDNYRKRQRRIAQEEARAEHERLLRDVLDIADNLERTLAAASQGEKGAIQEGVQLTRDELARLLKKHGVDRFRARGEPFDPAWHEAVGVTPAEAYGAEAGTVVEVVRPGYRRGGRLFRPARVVVAS
jgi:molecular chaperone GrpE